MLDEINLTIGRKIYMAHIKEVTTDEVEEMLHKESDVILIDVREDEEVAQGMIEGALHIPLNQIPEKAESLDKTKEYILVCRSGARSLNAALYMEEKGFHVSNMVGGMLDWNGEVIIK